MLTELEQAKQMRNEYLRNWRKNNKSLVKEYNQNYWIRKVREKETSHEKDKADI